VILRLVPRFNSPGDGVSCVAYASVRFDQRKTSESAGVGESFAAARRLSLFIVFFDGRGLSTPCLYRSNLPLFLQSLRRIADRGPGVCCGRNLYDGGRNSTSAPANSLLNSSIYPFASSEKNRSLHAL